MAQPLPVIPLEYEHPAAGAMGKARALRVLAIVTWFVCALALWLIVAVDVESVIVTGPIIAILGAMITVRGLLERRSMFAIIGAGHLVICLLFVTLVNWRGWSPSEATKPFTIIGTLYVIGSGLGSGWALAPSHWRRVAAARI